MSFLPVVPVSPDGLLPLDVLLPPAPIPQSGAVGLEAPKVGTADHTAAGLCPRVMRLVWPSR